MANTLSDLTGHLFEQLERLKDGSLKGEELDAEVKRTDAIVAVSDRVVDNARLQLAAAKLFAEHGHVVLEMLPQIGKARQ